MEAKNTVFMPVKVLHHPHVMEPRVVAQRPRDSERFPVETQPVQVGEVPELGLRRRADPSRSQAAARRKKLGHHSEAPLQFFVQINVPRKGELENPEPGRRPVHIELGCNVKAQISIQWIIRWQVSKIAETHHFSPHNRVPAAFYPFEFRDTKGYSETCERLSRIFNETPCFLT